MEDKKKEIMNNLIEDRITTLNRNKEQLEEQITKDTAKEQELPELFVEQRREKLAETIKELKILEDEKTTIDDDSVDAVE